MSRGRLEAFSDGVLAVIITVMVLELKVPHGEALATLRPLISPFLAYVLSYVYIGIYWNNHHHLMHTVERVSGAVMWANLHLLFWLSLFPAMTAWAGDNPRAAYPTAAYGVVLLAAALAWLVLQRAIIRAGNPLAPMLGNDLKGKLSPAIYIAGIALAFVQTWVSDLLFACVAAMWIVPDRRFEQPAPESERG
ncbi:MAG: TMEM175 family protein [Polyangiaceae bacterium]|nr:TMEM175 family protein [Polyangiaceae bacterium]